MSPLARRVAVPSPPQPASRWPGLVSSLGGEVAIAAFTAENGGEQGPTRWEGGLGFQPNICPDDTTPKDGCSQTAFTFDNPTDCPDVVEAAPVIFWSAVQRSTFNRNQSLRDLATNELRLATSYKLEKEWWRGDAAQAYGYDTQYLADGNLTALNSSTATPLAYALGDLVAAAAVLAQGQRLMIHCTPKTATLWESARVVQRDGGLLLDTFGNLVVPGTGYDGSDDGGDASDGFTAWAYATLIPQVRLGQIIAIEGQMGDMQNIDPVDATENLAVGVAYRAGVVTMDPCVQLGINVDLCNTCCTAP